MARVFVSKDILARIARHDGLSKNLKAFVEACQSDKTPPRIYKPSGISSDGREYLHHHHLRNDGDPLLITQHIDDCIYGIGISTHADYFHGDKMQWLKDHAHMIDWTGFEGLHDEVLAYDPDSDL